MSLTLPYIVTFFLVVTRLGALFFLIPAFGGRIYPTQVKIALIVATTVLIVPSVPLMQTQQIGIWELAFYALGEVIIGLFLGISLRAFFGIIEVAGEIISRNIGLMMAQQFDPNSGSNSNVIGVLLFYFGTILFFIIGGHHQVLLSLVQSYQIVPMDKSTLSVGSLSSVTNLISQIFALAVSLGAPFIAVNFIITLGFGVLGKVAPKINVMMISFSFRIVGGLVIFLITINLIFNFLLHYSKEIPDSMLEFIY
jgi:flagellar biosynthetic protein FliR